MIPTVNDENGKDCFFLSRQAWRWVGSFECFKRDIPQIRHSCDVRGVSYLVNGTTFYIGADHSSPHMIFDEVKDTLKRYFQIFGAQEIKLADIRAEQISLLDERKKTIWD